MKVMIEDEKAAVNKYQLAVEEADSKELKAALERLRDEEEIHIDFLEHEISKLETA